jgi:hypothetical protein
MSKPNTLEICRKYLFDNPDKELSPQIKDKLIRIRAAFTHWLEFPMKSELEIRNFLLSSFEIKTNTSYNDIDIVKALLGNVKNPSKEWHRYRFNSMVEESYAIAIAKQDPKALSMIMREYGKNNMLHIPDSEHIPYEDIIPQFIEPTEDPTVVGLKRDNEVRQKAKAMFDKYVGDISETIQAITLEEVEEHTDESD